MTPDDIIRIMEWGTFYACVMVSATRFAWKLIDALTESWK